MNLYKFNFDLAGSSNTIQTITIPTDSKYSVGVKFFKGNEELIISDDITVTIQDDKYIYTPTEIFNNYAVFAGSTGSNGSKTYKVNFHKAEKPAKRVSYEEIDVQSGGSVFVGITLQQIIDATGQNFEDFDYGQYRYYYENKVDGKDYTNWEDAEKTDVQVNNCTSLAIHSEDYPTYIYTNIPGRVMTYGDGEKKIYMWRINGKYGFISHTTMTEKFGQPVSENDFLTGSISDWFGGNIPESSRIFKKFSKVPGNTIVNCRLYGKPIPAVDANFKGITVRTNDSKIANWAITDSQMKIVYTDEWPELSATADDRLIYFIVDKPTPPQPVPPKPVPPTPGGDYAFDMFEKNGDMPTRETTFDPTNIEDCIAVNDFVAYKKYNINGQDIYLAINTDTSQSQMSEQYPDMGKTDIVYPAIFPSSGESGDEHQAAINGFMIQDGILKMGWFHKDFQSDDEVNEYIENYLSGINEYEPPFEYPLPDDINEFEATLIDISEFADVEKTNDGYYKYYTDDDFSEKLFIPLSTYPQWTSIGPD